MKKPKVKKVTVAMRMGKLTILQLIYFAKHVIASMTNNPHFSSPSPSLASMSTNIQNLEAAVAAAKYGPPTATEDMHAKKKVLYDAMKQMGAYVEGIANLDPPNAAAIATSAGVGLKNDPKPRASGFRLTLTGVPGQVKLYALSVKAASYKWEYTLTPADASSWISLDTNVAKLLITGLTSGQRYSFRVAAVLKTLQPWSQVISTLVP
jgi:hypothetical protein